MVHLVSPVVGHSFCRAVNRWARAGPTTGVGGVSVNLTVRRAVGDNEAGRSEGRSRRPARPRDVRTGRETAVGERLASVLIPPLQVISERATYGIYVLHVQYETLMRTLVAGMMWIGYNLS